MMCAVVCEYVCILFIFSHITNLPHTYTLTHTPYARWQSLSRFSAMYEWILQHFGIYLIKTTFCKYLDYAEGTFSQMFGSPSSDRLTDRLTCYISIALKCRAYTFSHGKTAKTRTFNANNKIHYATKSMNGTLHCKPNKAWQGCPCIYGPIATEGTEP